MKITGIKPQEKRKNRASIFVDGVFKLGVSENVVADFVLYVGKEISEKDFEQLAEAESTNKAFEKAYRLLSFRARSQKELIDSLSEKFTPETVAKIISRLKEYNYVDDAAFARAWVEERKFRKGRKALFFELIKKGVAKEIIEDVLEEVTSEEEATNAYEAVQKKSIYLKMPEPERRQKITAFLARRGYSYDVIKKVLENI